MNPDFLAKLLAALGMSPAPAGTPSTPKPQTFSDTLAALIGGMPAVVNAAPPADPHDVGTRGEYRGPGYYTPGRDSLYLNPAADTTPGHVQPPRDYLLSHELGHRLYAQSNPNLDPESRPSGVRDPALAPLTRQTGTEGFAQAMAAALEHLRAAGTGRPEYTPASYDQHPPVPVVSALQAWMLKQPAYQNYSPAPIRPDVTAVRKP